MEDQVLSEVGIMQAGQAPRRMKDKLTELNGKGWKVRQFIVLQIDSDRVSVHALCEPFD